MESKELIHVKFKATKMATKMATKVYLHLITGATEATEKYTLYPLLLPFKS